MENRKEESAAGKSKFKLHALELVYTEQCGYGHIEFPGSNSSDIVITDKEILGLPEMVPIKLFSGAVATIHKSSLKNKIPVRVKSFHGSREIYTIEVGIDKTVDDLKEALRNSDTKGELKDFLQLNLIHTIVSPPLTNEGKIKGAKWKREDSGPGDDAQDAAGGGGSEALHVGRVAQGREHRCTRRDT